MSAQEPAYELQVSRIFNAPPPAVRSAFTDPGLRAKWLPTAGRPMPDPTESGEGESLTWTEQPASFGGADGGPGSTGRTVRIQLCDEPDGKTLLELRAGPYNEAGESDARAWWNSAFSHLDTALERNGG